MSDEGRGMSERVLAQASEPFFTTKSPGEATGLGLAMARGFAEQTGGGMRIDSAEGIGTTITLWLPAAS
jgi:signal transduction histidine kinase